MWPFQKAATRAGFSLNSICSETWLVTCEKLPVPVWVKREKTQDRCPSRESSLLQGGVLTSCPNDLGSQAHRIFVCLETAASDPSVPPGQEQPAGIYQPCEQGAGSRRARGRSRSFHFIGCRPKPACLPAGPHRSNIPGRSAPAASMQMLPV